MSIEILIFVGLMALGYFAGSAAEKKHFANLVAREKGVFQLETTNHKRFNAPDNVAEVQMFTGSAVIAVDYFKVFVAGLMNVFGGEVTTYESLLDRARREATLRLKEQAQEWGADAIYNLRIETANLNSFSKKPPNVEALAYATAVRFQR